MNVEKVTEEKNHAIPKIWTTKHESRKVFKNYGDSLKVMDNVITCNGVKFHQAALFRTRDKACSNYDYYVSEGYLALHCNPEMNTYDTDESFDQLLHRLKPPRILTTNRLKFDPSGKTVSFKITGRPFELDYIIAVDEVKDASILDDIMCPPKMVRDLMVSTRARLYENTLIATAQQPTMYPTDRSYMMAIMLWCELCCLDCEFDNYIPSPINKFMEKGGFNFGPEHIKGKD